MALDEHEMTPRELAARFTNSWNYFLSEASVYRLLKAHDLINGPTFIVIKVADEFKDKTIAINQLWQTDFTYLWVIRWEWRYLFTIRVNFAGDGLMTYGGAIELQDYFAVSCRRRVQSLTTKRAQ